MAEALTPPPKMAAMQHDTNVTRSTAVKESRGEDAYAKFSDVRNIPPKQTISPRSRIYTTQKGRLENMRPQMGVVR